MNDISQQDTKKIKLTATITAALSAFLTPFTGSSINIAIPTIGKEFATDAVTLSWVATAYLLASAVFLLPAGKIADIVGRKKVFVAGLAVFTLSSMLSALSMNIAQLISFRIIQGLGSAMIFGTGMAIISSIFPPGERGKIIGINAAAVYLGLTLGPFLGGIIINLLGWRAVFLFMIPLSLIALIMAIAWLKGEWAEAKNEKFDFFGAFIYAISICAFIYGLSIVTIHIGIILAAIGLSGLIFFIIWEGRQQYPLLNTKLFKENRIFAFSNLAAFINYSASFAIGFILSIHLQHILGLTPAQAGMVLLSQPLIMTLFSIVAGRLSDTYSASVVSSLGMAITTVGIIILLFVLPTFSILYIIFSLLIIGLGFALFSSPNTNAVMNSVSKQFYGVASATIGTMRLTGQMMSMALTTIIIALYIGKNPIESNKTEFTNGVALLLTIFSVLCFVGIFASLARGKTNGKAV